MELKDASAFVTNFKGAALSCFILMWTMRDDRRNWTRNDLADLTGWNRENVAQGLRRLALHDLVLRVNYETWQLTDKGLQLSFETLRVDNIDSESRYYRLSHGSSGLKNHDHEYDSHKKQPPLSRVDIIDSHVVRDPIFDELVSDLIRCGAAPEKAHEAIDEAWSGDTSDQDIRRRILWWRCYCVTHNGIKFPGHLISARVAAGIDTPADFQPRDIPPRFSDLRDELEDFERQYQNQSQ